MRVSSGILVLFYAHDLSNGTASFYPGMIGQTCDACLLQNVGQKESKGEARSAVRRSYADPLGLFFGSS
jgi:hypothetical protein